VIPECKDIHEELGEFLTFYYLKYGNIACSVDENGDICPFSKLSRNNRTYRDNKEEMIQKTVEAVNETCKSKRCIDSFKIYSSLFIVYIKNLNNSEKKREFKLTEKELEEGDDYYELEKINEYLNSKECTSQIVTVSDNKPNTYGTENKGPENNVTENSGGSSNGTENNGNKSNGTGNNGTGNNGVKSNETENSGVENIKCFSKNILCLLMLLLTWYLYIMY